MFSRIRAGRHLDDIIENFQVQSSSIRDRRAATEHGGDYLLSYACEYYMFEVNGSQEAVDIPFL